MSGSQVQADQARELQTCSCIVASIVLHAATTTGLSVDTKGFRSVTALLSVNTLGDSATRVWTLQESDTNVNANFTDVAVGDLAGGAQFGAVVAGTDQVLSYVGGKRFIRFKAVLGAGTTDDKMAGIVILGRPFSKPTTAVQLGVVAA